MSKFLNALNHRLAELCGWLLCAVMLFIFFDFVSRGLGKPLFGVAEMAMFAMVATVYLGLAHCEEVRGHVRVEAVLIRLPHRVQVVLNLIIYVISVIVIGIVTYAVWMNTLAAFADKEAIAGAVPLVTYPVKFIMSFALTVYFAQICVHAVGHYKECVESFGRLPSD
jgi:TRAP-type C4-dicarboxylate transport system permease small subunit